VIIADQAGFHLPPDDSRLPDNLRLLASDFGVRAEPGAGGEIVLRAAC